MATGLSVPERVILLISECPAGDAHLSRHGRLCRYGGLSGVHLLEAAARLVPQLRTGSHA